MLFDWCAQCRVKFVFLELKVYNRKDSHGWIANITDYGHLFFQKSRTFGLGQTFWAEIFWGIWVILKVSKSQNKFMKSSFLPKNEQNIARISALTFRAEILAIFRSFVGRNGDFVNLFWDLLTFSPPFVL